MAPHTRRKHVLMLSMPPFLAHVVGAYKLVLELLKRNVTVTFVSQAKDISFMETFDELRGLDIHLLAYDGKSREWDPKTDDVRTATRDLRTRFQPINEKLLADREAGIPGPTCIIADRFLYWAADVAKELSAKHYFFFSCGAIYARTLVELPGLIDEGTLTVTNTVLDRFEGSINISGIPAIRYGDLSHAMRIIPENMTLVGTSLMSEDVDGMIINTFYELDQGPIDAIQQVWSAKAKKKDQKVFGVGPLPPAGAFQNRTASVKEAGLDDVGPESLQWLDSRPGSSVLYICLGSITRLSPAQIHEVALALQASEQSFLWVLPKGRDNFSSLEEVLPTDYQVRMKEKGLVVCGWVPQVEILSHPALKGFVTHCGWNSVIEGINLGVPMVAWPQSNEQFLNCRLLVDSFRIAVGLARDERDPQNTFVGHKEFERAVRVLMVGVEGMAMKSRVMELQTKAKAAVAIGGSSDKALQALVDHI